MNCISKDRKGAGVLTDYCAGTLDPVQTAGIEEHIRECAECFRIVEAQRSLWQTLDAWKPIEVSADFDARLYAKISQAQAEPWWNPRAWRRLWQFPAPLSLWKPALSIAAVAVVLALLVAVRTPDKTVAPAEPAAQRINIQEVQQALDDLDLLTPAAANTRSPL